MNIGISKRLIVSSFLFFNFIQQSKSVEFSKIDKSENNQTNQLSSEGTLINKSPSNSSLNKKSHEFPLEKNFLSI